MSVLIDIGSIIYFFIAISAIESMPLLASVSFVLLVAILWERKSYPCFIYPPYKYIVFFLFAVSIEILFSENNPSQYILSRISLFLPIFLFDYYRNHKNGPLILKTVIIIWMIISVRAFILLFTGIFVPKAVMMHLQAPIPFSGGGYPLAVGSALLACYLLDDMLWTNEKKTQKLFIIIFLSVVVVLTQSTITLIAMFIGFIFSVVLKFYHISSISEMNYSLVIRLLLIVVVVLLILFFRKDIGDLIMSIGAEKSDTFSRRIVEFGCQISGDNCNGIDLSDSEDRFDRMLDSMFIFFEHPVMGLTSHLGTDHFILGHYGVGNHSEFFDSIAKFGLFAGVPYLAIFFTGVKYEREIEIKKISFGYIFALITLFILNPFLYVSSNCVLFFIIPMITIIRNRSQFSE